MTQTALRATCAATLAQIRASALEQRTLATLPVPLLYQFSELKFFDAAQHPALLIEAREHATKEPSFFTLWLWSAIVAVLVSFAVSLHSMAVPLLNAWAIATLIVLPTYFYQRELMRRYIRQRARQIAVAQATAELKMQAV